MKIKELIIEECKDMQHEERRGIFIQKKEIDFTAIVFALKETERDDSNGEYTSRTMLKLSDVYLYFEDTVLSLHNFEIEF
jgi:hypothetical protein